MAFFMFAVFWCDNFCCNILKKNATTVWCNISLNVSEEYLTETAYSTELMVRQYKLNKMSHCQWRLQAIFDQESQIRLLKSGRRVK